MESDENIKQIVAPKYFLKPENYSTNFKKIKQNVLRKFLKSPKIHLFLVYSIFQTT